MTFVQELEDFLSHYRVGYELEVRFFEKVGQGVPIRWFERLRSSFQASLEVNETLERCGSQRRITQGSNIRIEQKEQRKLLTTTQYPFRIVLSEEIPLDTLTCTTPLELYQRQRFSYPFGNYRLDLSRLYQDGYIVMYQAELEYIGTSLPVATELFSRVQELLKIMLQTEELYTLDQRADLIHYYNDGPEDVLNYNQLTQSRTLELSDLNTLHQKNYTVTHKADGERRIALFTENGVWLVYPPNEVNWLTKSVFPELTGVVLDGELIPPEKRNNGAPHEKYWYAVFDALADSTSNHPGSEWSIQAKTHLERMLVAQRAEDITRDQLNFFKLEAKIFQSWLGSHEFYTQMRIYQAQVPNLSFQTDGLVFTPEAAPYKNKETYKWKPLDQLTIDFSYDQGELLSYQKGELVPFKGTRQFPWIKRTALSPLLKDLKVETVVEFIWRDGHFEPTRIRYDKASPNSLTVAQRNWEAIMEPLTVEILTGRDTSLFRRYHNQIKRRLLNLELEREHYTLLDLGSGRGGDVHSWRSFDRVVAVEPNKSHLVELRRRVQQLDLENKVLIVEAYAQDTALITEKVIEFIGHRVDMVSMMNVLPLAASSQEAIDGIMSTVLSNLAAHGAFLFMTMDGLAVKESMRDPVTGENLTVLDFGMAALRLEGESVLIDIPGTIVEKQTEHLVYTDDLLARLYPAGYQTYKFRRADEEKTLPENQLLFSSLFTYGYFRGTGGDFGMPRVQKLQNILPEVMVSAPDVEVLPMMPLRITSPVATPPSRRVVRPTQRFTNEPVITPIVNVVPEVRVRARPARVVEVVKEPTEVPTLEEADGVIQAIPAYVGYSLYRVGVFTSRSFYHSLLAALDPTYQREKEERARLLAESLQAVYHYEYPASAYPVEGSRELLEFVVKTLEINIYRVILLPELKPLDHYGTYERGIILHYAYGRYEPIVLKSNDLFQSILSTNSDLVRRL